MILSIHPEIGVAPRWKLYPASPDEGSIYKGRVA